MKEMMGGEAIYFYFRYKTGRSDRSEGSDESDGSDGP